MTVNDLKYFEAVCAHKSISVAAQCLHISQPSLSIAIKGLEKEFGVALFERKHSGIVLTAEGEALYEKCKSVLKSFDEAEEMMHDLGNKRRSIRIGIPPMIGSLLLPYICGDFKKENPDIRLDVTEAGSRELSRRLNDGQLDMVFLPHKDKLPDDLSAIKVAQLEVVCCASKNDEIAAWDFVSPKDLAQKPLVLFNSSFFQTELIKRQFSECRVEPKIILQTDQLSTVESVVESGVAVGFLFGALIKRRSRLAMIPLADEIAVSVSLAYRRCAYMSDSMRAFKSFAGKMSVAIAEGLKADAK